MNEKCQCCGKSLKYSEVVYGKKDCYKCQDKKLDKDMEEFLTERALNLSLEQRIYELEKMVFKKDYSKIYK